MTGAGQTRQSPSLIIRLSYYALLLLFGTATLVFNLFAMVRILFPVSEQTRVSVQKVFRNALCGYLWLLEKTGKFRCEVKNDDNGRLDGITSSLIIANHPSMLDAPILLAKIPRAICYYKSSMHRGLFSNAGARLAGYVSNSSGIDGVRHVVAHLRSGGNVILFPEGTRSPQEGIGEFHSGFSLIAVQADCPVVCLQISSTSNILSKSHWFLNTPTIPVHFQITTLATIHPQRTERASAFAQRVKKVYSHVQRLA